MLEEPVVEGPAVAPAKTRARPARVTSPARQRLLEARASRVQVADPGLRARRLAEAPLPPDEELRSIVRRAGGVEVVLDTSLGLIGRLISGCGLPPAHKALLFHLASECDWTARLWRTPTDWAQGSRQSMGRIADAVGVTPRQLQRIRRDCADVGVLIVSDRRPRYSCYQLVPRALEALRAATEAWSRSRAVPGRRDEPEWSITSWRAPSSAGTGGAGEGGPPPARMGEDVDGDVITGDTSLSGEGLGEDMRWADVRDEDVDVDAVTDEDGGHLAEDVDGDAVADEGERALSRWQAPSAAVEACATAIAEATGLDGRGCWKSVEALTGGDEQLLAALPSAAALIHRAAASGCSSRPLVALRRRGRDRSLHAILRRQGWADRLACAQAHAEGLCCRRPTPRRADGGPAPLQAVEQPGWWGETLRSLDLDGRDRLLLRALRIEEEGDEVFLAVPAGHERGVLLHVEALARASGRRLRLRR